MSLYKNLYTYYDSGFAQAIVNHFPDWTRARTSKDSIAYKFATCYGPYFDDVFRQIQAIKQNNYISTCDTKFDGVIYTTDIPYNFLLTYKASSGKVLYYPPEIEAQLGADAIDVEVVGDLEDLLKALPTRISLGSDSYDVIDVVEPTAIEDLSTATINDIEYDNWLYLTVQGGTDYGTVNDIRFFYPASVVIDGELHKQVSRTEGKVYFADNVARTWQRYHSVDSIAVDNIDSDALLTISSWGFNLPWLSEISSELYTINGKNPLFYTLEVDSNKSILHYNIRESSNIQLQRQGIAAMISQFSSYLCDEAGEDIELNDIGKLDNSDLIFGVDDDTLYVFDTYIPASTNQYIKAALKLRTIDTHIGLEIKPLTRTSFLIDEPIVFTTKQKTPMSRVSRGIRVRLYSVDESGAKTYLNSAGATVTADNAWRYNDISVRGTIDWLEKRWTASLDSYGYRAFVLETQYLQPNPHPVTNVHVDKTEYDVLVVSVNKKNALVQFDLDEDIVPVSGITFDFNQKLWVKSDADDKAYGINLHYDVALIDYKLYKVYFRELYDNINSITANTDVNNPGQVPTSPIEVP